MHNILCIVIFVYTHTVIDLYKTDFEVHYVQWLYLLTSTFLFPSLLFLSAPCHFLSFSFISALFDFFVVICFGFYFFSFKIYWLFLIFICVSVIYTFPTLPEFGPPSLPVQLNFASFLFSLEDQLYSQNILRYNFWLRYGQLTRVF